jgi:PhnB protein
LKGSPNENEKKEVLIMFIATPYLRVKDSAAALEFYKLAFGAEELYRLTEPSGVVGHAEFTINGAHFMIANEFPEYGILGPQSIGGTSVGLHLKVDDTDRVIHRAIAAGAIVASPVTDQFYGERAGTVTDPFGHSWLIASTIEQVSPEEMQKRYSAMF